MHTRQGVAAPALSQDTVLTAPTCTMYPRESNLDGKTRHSRHCKALFGRRDWNCHRCCELLLNAAPRKGWQRDYFRRKLNQSQRWLPW